MRVLHVTNYDNLGGAGIAAYRLHTALRKAGVDSRMLVRTKGSSDPFVSEIGSRRSEVGGQKTADRNRFQRFERLQRARRAFQRLPVRARGWMGAKLTKALGMEGCSLNIFPTGLHKVLNASDADVIHLHWVNNEMISIKEVAKIKKPLVWTLHDCWPFLGAEHHSSEWNDAGVSEYWSRGVGDGGQTPTTSNQQSVTRDKLYNAVNKYIFRLKERAWKQLRISFVAPSSWMAEQVWQSRLFSDVPIAVIPNCLNLNVFQPLEKTECRRRWNLPQDKKLILFGAYNPMDLNKGMDLLEKALLAMPESDRNGVELAVFGADGSHDIAELKTHWLGVVSFEEEMAELYNTADAVCVPSRRESFGQTASEAMACGVPVVAFRTSGLKDIVDHQENGWLADPYDAEDFCRGIRWILNRRRGNETLSVRARAKAESLIAYPTAAQQYAPVYKDLITDVTSFGVSF